MDERLQKDGREVFLLSVLIAGLFLALGTESLSAFHALTREGVFLFWLVVAAAVLLFSGFCRHGIPSIRVPYPYRREPCLRRHPLNSMFGFIPSGKFEISVVVILSFMALALFVQGFFSAPNTFDSMTYHLSRVMHWAQNRSIEFYPTAIERQLWMPPLAEYGVLHLYLLTGSDRLAFLPQWIGYIGCIVSASMIAGCWGADRRGQVIAAALCAAIPMAVLQSVSTQTDLVAGFWGMSSVVWFLLWSKRGHSRGYALCGAAALALGVLTKLSVLLVLPVIILILLLSNGPLVLRRALMAMGLICLAVLLVNGPHMARVYACFHTLSPASAEGRLTNERASFRTVVFAGIKNLALHLTVPSDRLNAWMRSGVDGLGQWLGVDGKDPAVDLAPGDRYLKKQHVFYESRAPNGLHVLLGIVVLGALVVGWRAYPAVVIGYGLALVVGFFLLSVVMKWQPWGGRFQLVLFMLGAPLAAFVLARMGMPARWLKIMTVAFLLLAACWAVFNSSHPWVGKDAFYRLTREEQYFMGVPERRSFFVSAADKMERFGCLSVGLKLSGQESWEYPLWAMLDARGLKVDLRHVDVPGKSRMYEDTSWKPCLVVGPEEVAP
jgi:4-amino-4-deoxy-L-arabinose transferase-like glycosyltransferase